MRCQKVFIFFALQNIFFYPGLGRNGAQTKAREKFVDLEIGKRVEKERRLGEGGGGSENKRVAIIL